ncbi:tRNA ligase-like protein [Lindgomyces ingoldianus]|uniref:tRNA ligase-like protein n=1 Tax=Lindgomyces ingoldianus TaxID=673940 RepID=A0ACB6Q9L3_9PLEO|nr:tRNA ligase-like protein [Lindgomyces ingoldianus]KAF2463225.1 tRNA ligase-like protein [Lindgomyces ingoldianus]
MAHRETAPYAPQDPHEIKTLIQALESHKGKKFKGGGGFSVKKATFKLPTGRSVDSWRMNDWDYKKPNLPTYARGLFTYRTMDGKDEIAVRGYDKFFNHGEVRKTEWRNVESHTRGPYELSVKENGCIIFIAGLDDDTLLVCSKHSTGARGDAELSHAIAGERWVDRHLAQVGKSKVDLARTLREMNATLVAELCDDEFEEHVLAYTPEQAGLYVHGLNLNLPDFATYPGHLVDKFADEWGMKKVIYVMEDDVTKVKAFLDQVAETGNYAGRDTEGFVIRCQARDSDNAPWHDWFFKYKFEEPYLMYRQWRECTKAMIAGKAPRYKKHEKITKEYLDFARRQFIQQPGLSKLYNMNHGIIKLRDDFLAWQGTTGAAIIRQERENGEVSSKDATRNIVLVPVATIGCGKTTLALALVKLFGWGHFQNDNVTVKKGRPQIFADSVMSLLAASPVVIADRNNHQKRERDQLLCDISRVLPDARFVALHYVHDRSNYDSIRQATRHRIFARGDNHQTIQAGSKSQDEILEIMEGFMHRFQPIDTSDSPDDGFDLVIDLDPTIDSRENLEVIVSKMSETYPKLFQGEMPNDTDLDAAIDWAMNDYKPDLKMDLSRGRNQPQSQSQYQNKRHTQNQPQSSQDHKPKKAPKMEYFSVRLNTQRIKSILDSSFRDTDAQTSRFYRQLTQARRVQPEFHVTLIHRAAVAEAGNMGYWEKLVVLHDAIMQQTNLNSSPSWEPELGKCSVQLERIVWDDKIMCFVVRLNGSAIVPPAITTSSAEGAELEMQEIPFQSVNPVAHVTVGTANQGIKPKESNDLLQRWLQGGSGEGTGVRELVVKGSIVLEGSVRGVLGRMNR